MVTVNALNQQKGKNWLVEAMFYIVSALLVVGLACYLIFFLKVYLEQQKIAEVQNRINAYGTDQQKAYKKEVFDYKKKIDDFAVLINNHTTASNVFTFIEKNTLANVWFSSFNMSTASHEVRLAGQAADMQALSQQFQAFESQTDYVQHISVLNSQSGVKGKITFTFNLLLTPRIFSPQNLDFVFNGNQ